MSQSIVIAEVKTFKQLRRPNEELIAFYIDENRVKSAIIKEMVQISSRVYNNFFIGGDAYMAFSSDKELKKRVALAKAEVMGKNVEYKLFVEDLKAVLNLIEVGQTARLREELYFEDIVAEYLGLYEGQAIMLMPSPVWKA
jgi:hypothetical protein